MAGRHPVHGALALRPRRRRGRGHRLARIRRVSTQRPTTAARARSLPRGTAWLLLAAASGAAADSPAALQLLPAGPTTDAARTAPLLRLGMARADVVEFELLAEFDCGAAAEPERLFVAIADTAVILPAASLASPQPVRLRVPRGQLRQITATSACPGTRPDRPTPGAYLLQDAVAGQGTLVCRGAEGRLVAHRAAAPLSVLVECGAESGPGLVDEALPPAQSAWPD